EMMAQLLLALAVRAPEAKLELLGFSSLIRVQQRELVRKAIQLGSGFSRCRWVQDVSPSGSEGLRKRSV
ncbi:unnamed protein product, partial [Symbiodinium microadriaticum]